LGQALNVRNREPTWASDPRAFVLYAHTGTDSTSRLIKYQDTEVTGLPLTPDGSDVQIAVDAGGWFVL
jgi:hypothetical protein